MSTARILLERVIAHEAPLYIQRQKKLSAEPETSYRVDACMQVCIQAGSKYTRDGYGILAGAGSFRYRYPFPKRIAHGE